MNGRGGGGCRGETFARNFYFLAARFHPRLKLFPKRAVNSKVLIVVLNVRNHKLKTVLQTLHPHNFAVADIGFHDRGYKNHF